MVSGRAVVVRLNTPSKIQKMLQSQGAFRKR